MCLHSVERPRTQRGKQGGTAESFFDPVLVFESHRDGIFVFAQPVPQSRGGLFACPGEGKESRL
jgi:hypothetical protein